MSDWSKQQVPLTPHINQLIEVGNGQVLRVTHDHQHVAGLLGLQ